MASVLLVECPLLEANGRIKDNKFMLAAHVSENQSQQDTILANALQMDILERLQSDLHTKVVSIRLQNERRSSRVHYEGKHECHFIADSMTMHHFTNAKGEITRRLVIMYPMSKGRQGEIPRDQIIHKITKKVAEGDGSLELVNLQNYEADKKYLEGQGALVFSHDGQFVYMAQSARTNDEVLDVVCSREILDIPEHKRFIFTTEFPHHEKNADVDPVYHTSLIGWCGKGICAFGFEFLKFSSDKKQEQFYQHIEQNYKKIINLNAKEIRAFAGNACELAVSLDNGDERRVLCISDTAIKAMQGRNRKVIEEWYGPGNIFVFYGDVVQRRSGASVRGLICNAITHGPVIPAQSEQSIVSLTKIDVRDERRI